MARQPKVYLSFVNGISYRARRVNKTLAGNTGESRELARRIDVERYASNAAY